MGWLRDRDTGCRLDSEPIVRMMVRYSLGIRNETDHWTLLLICFWSSILNQCSIRLWDQHTCKPIDRRLVYAATGLQGRVRRKYLAVWFTVTEYNSHCDGDSAPSCCWDWQWFPKNVNAAIASMPLGNKISVPATYIELLINWHIIIYIAHRLRIWRA